MRLCGGYARRGRRTPVGPWRCTGAEMESFGAPGSGFVLRLSLPRLSGALCLVPRTALVLGICTRGAATPWRARGRVVGGHQSLSLSSLGQDRLRSVPDCGPRIGVPGRPLRCTRHGQERRSASITESANAGNKNLVCRRSVGGDPVRVQFLTRCSIRSGHGSVLPRTRPSRPISPGTAPPAAARGSSRRLGPEPVWRSPSPAQSHAQVLAQTPRIRISYLLAARSHSSAAALMMSRSRDTERRWIRTARKSSVHGQCRSVLRRGRLGGGGRGADAGADALWTADNDAPDLGTPVTLAG